MVTGSRTTPALAVGRREVEARRLGTLVYLAVLGFVVCMGIAIVAYPGGNLWDHSRRGYDFWLNFWCDLLRHPAYNGAPNPVAPRFAQLGMVSLALGIAAYFALAPRMFGSVGWLSRAVTVAGVLGGIGLLLVTAVSSRAHPTVHGVAVLTAGPMGLSAVLGTIVGLARSADRHRLCFWLGALMLAVASFTLVQYVREFAYSAPSSEWLPRSQKVATLLALGWMCVVSTAAVRASGPSG
jgi:hypothetical protein